MKVQLINDYDAEFVKHTGETRVNGHALPVKEGDVIVTDRAGTQRVFTREVFDKLFRKAR